MKKTILSIAVIAAAIFAASCQKENPQENTASEENTSVFTATIESRASTKTTVERIDGTPATYKTKWENGDQISINGVTYTATPDVTDATKATFTKVSGEAPTGTFYAYFPANLYNNGTPTLPANVSETWADGKYNMPMYATSTTTSLSFKNLCGVLAITVNGTDFTSVSSIEVSSDKQMNGEFSAEADGTLTFKTEGVTLTDALKKVTLTFTSAKIIASDGSATFYIPVPADTHNPLTIKVTGGSSTKIMVTKKSGGVAVARNTVYPITFKEPTTGAAERTGGISVNWVQLWENGPKFAEYNVGATSVIDYGGYYAWGGSQDKVDDHNTGTVDLSPTSDPITDTATKLWGSNWRMPTQTELQGLIDNCTSDGTKFTGKGAYASNSVFLPAAGGYNEGSVTGQGGGGLFWSSSPGESDSAAYGLFSFGSPSVISTLRNTGGSVRAVLAEED